MAWDPMGQSQLTSVVDSNCDPHSFQNELNNYKISTRHKILQNSFNYDCNTRVEDVICTCKNSKSAKRILPIPGDSIQHQICVYPQCPRVLFTSFMRQLRENDITTVNDNIVKEYHSFCDVLFSTEIEPILHDFDYDVDEWMNHITTYNKQMEVHNFYTAWQNNIKNGIDWDKNYYTLFAKSEKQILEPGKMPKCRAISAAPPNVKWIMGPIVYALEKIYKKVDGYKVSVYDDQLNVLDQAKTWEQQEESLDKLYAAGLNQSIDIDGSAWDSTQTHHMKYLINKIYNWLCDNGKIHHVETELFRKVATERFRKLTAKAYIGGKTYIVFSANIDSTTFSGSMDTTWANTETNRSVAEFSRTRAKLNKTQWKHSCAGDDYKGHIASETLNSYPVEKIIKETWCGLGLIPKYVIIGDYTNITFCSTNVIQYPENGIMKHKIIRQLNRLNPLAHYSIEALSYSTAQMKTYYNDLAIGMKNWATNLPYFENYIAAYNYYRDKIKIKALPIGTPTKPKIHYGTSNITITKTGNYEQELLEIRVSKREPPRHYVEDFLLDKFSITKSDIEQHRFNLIFERYYDPLGPHSST